MKQKDLEINLQAKYNDMILTPLYLAVIENKIEVVNLLLSNKDINIDIMNEINYYDDTYEKMALYVAVQQNYIPIINILLSYKSSSINAKQLIESNEKSFEQTILCWAVENDNSEIIQLLLKNESLVNKKSICKHTLEKSGLTIKMTSEKTPIEFAIEKRNAGIIQLLAQNEKIAINQFSTISDLNEDQEITALCTAAESRNSEIDKVLLTSKNIDCNLQC